MKKLCLIIMVAFAATGFQACKSGSGNSSTTDSTSVSKDSSSKKDSTSTASASTAPVDKSDSTFAVTAANDGMAEVAMGKVAQQKAASTRVKNFASMMVTDHSKANDELKTIASKKNITLPSAPNAEKQQMADNMSKMSGKAFDKHYVNAMIGDHEKAVKLFTDASQNCKDADLKAFATNTLPTLKMHLDSIKAIKASMK